MNLDELASAVSKCREGWKSPFGRYPDRIWDNALAMIQQNLASVEQVSEVMNIKPGIIRKRLVGSLRTAKATKASPAFVEFRGVGDSNGSVSVQRLSPESAAPHLVMHSKNGSELRAHLPLEPSVKLQSLIQKLVSCWVLAHR